MPSTITNLTSQPLWISLNSGSSLRLSPRQAVEGVADEETRGNPKLRKLKEQRQIAVVDAEATAGEAAGQSDSRREEEGAQEEGAHSDSDTSGGSGGEGG